MMEANCTVIGGHSIRDDELKFGYAVTGSVHPKRVLANSGARAGDALLLTKALGTGVISTAIKRGKAEPAWVEAATESMTALNRAAMEAVTKHEGQVHGLTDVTGFGLIGHARELALASSVSLRLFASKVSLLAGALECVRAGFVPAGLKNNRDFAECVVSYEGNIPEEVKTLLFDPQTAGGLLISVTAAQADQLLRNLQAADVPAARIGEVLPQAKALIRVLSTEY
jgi:selenide,water dikinase